ncbi:hypothetical protein [Stagnihabitans tardus]|uniref:Uncharacterized protein n=1 Tax=Stagnihabitans tardus TaxID=2699202 RepID=A0AAE4Y9Y5_9RHOB|nr:hypothetical protein [Stagnihabitans tardus]NBZ88711.1 hypothetical protein [Stagnihabitans tardus]
MSPFTIEGPDDVPLEFATLESLTRFATREKEFWQAFSGYDGFETLVHRSASLWTNSELMSSNGDEVQHEEVLRSSLGEMSRDAKNGVYIFSDSAFALFLASELKRDRRVAAAIYRQSYSPDTHVRTDQIELAAFFALIAFRRGLVSEALYESVGELTARADDLRAKASHFDSKSSALFRDFDQEINGRLEAFEDLHSKIEEALNEREEVYKKRIERLSSHYRSKLDETTAASTSEVDVAPSS